MGKEKRRFKRLPIRGFMKCSADFRFNDRNMAGVDVLSLSAGGMFIALENDLSRSMAEGDHLQSIRIHLNDLDGMNLTGQVAHCMSLGEIGGCGVEFHGLGEETEQQIDSYVHRKLQEFGLAAF